MSDALEMAVFFHETYERLAPSFGYATREDTKQFDPSSNNGRLMQAVCAAWLEQRDARIRELEQELSDAREFNRDYLRLYDEATKKVSALEAQIAAHEKVCAGTWVRCSERLPDPAELPRVVVHTKGFDFGGEQYFDVESESLRVEAYEFADEQPHVCRVASCWLDAKEQQR